MPVRQASCITDFSFSGPAAFDGTCDTRLSEMGKDIDNPAASEHIPAPEDNVKPLNYKEQFSGRHVTSKFIDPCAAASKASMDCLNRSDYDRDSCLDYFQAYRDCKNTWIKQRKEDRRADRA